MDNENQPIPPQQPTPAAPSTQPQPFQSQPLTTPTPQPDVQSTIPAQPGIEQPIQPVAQQEAQPDQLTDEEKSNDQPKDQAELAQQNPKKKGIKEFFKNPTNVILVIILAILVIVIIVVIVSTISQNSKPQNTASPEEGTNKTAESTSDVKSDENYTVNQTTDDTSTTQAAEQESGTIECAIKTDAYSQKSTYKVKDGKMYSYSTTIDVDKINPETLSKEDQKMYSYLTDAGKQIIQYKDANIEGIDVISSETDANLYAWTLINRDKLDDSQLIKKYFVPYDDLTLSEMVEAASFSAGQNVKIPCELK